MASRGETPTQAHAPALVGRAALLTLALMIAVTLWQGPGSGARQVATAAPGALAQFLLLFAGFGIGCYGTLVGIGGGPLVVPALVLVYGWEPRNVVATSLLVVFLNALSGSLGYAYQRRVDYRGGVKFALAALPGSVLSGLVHHYFSIGAFNGLFGIFLLLLAAYCLIGLGRLDDPRRIQNPSIAASHRVVALRDRLGTRYRFGVNDELGTGLNLVLGFLVGFLGIGGGVLQVPILVFALGYPVHVATATSHFITMLTCSYALAPNVAFGNVHLAEALWMGLGVVIGAQLGAWLSPRVRSAGIMLLFIAIILLFAARLLWT